VKKSKNFESRRLTLISSHKSPVFIDLEPRRVRSFVVATVPEL